MRIALAVAGAVDVRQLKESASNATLDLVAPAPDPLAEFGPEWRAPARPVPITVRPARGPVEPAPRETPPRDTTPRNTTSPAVDTRRASPAPVTGANWIPAAPARSAVKSFVLGLVCGALLCLLAVYSITGREVARPDPGPGSLEPAPPAVAPVLPAASEIPAPEPATAVVASALRDLPPIDKDLLAPPELMAKSRNVREAARQAPPPQETKKTAFVGALQIDSTPRGAQVFVDRKAVGVTPVLVTDLSAGSHAIRVEADGHMPWSSAVRVIADRQTDVSTILSPSSPGAPPR
jgi:hypothetical protein